MSGFSKSNTWSVFAHVDISASMLGLTPVVVFVVDLDTGTGSSAGSIITVDSAVVGMIVDSDEVTYGSSGSCEITCTHC